MTKEKEYFIHLLSCFLNGSAPNCAEVDWKEIYRLCDMHDVQGIIAQMIKQLPSEFQPEKSIKSYFNQQLGFTVMDYEFKEQAKAELVKLLNDLGVDHLLVKGAVIRSLYPIPELRTSGDIDVIVRSDEYENAVEKLKEIIPNTRYTADVFYFKINDVKIEMHKYSDVETNYFDDIFSLAKNTESHTFELDEYNHLLYVLCHLCHHLRYRGAGIRMLMDIDVMIRSINDFNQEYFEYLCKKAGFEKSWGILSSLSRLWFNTPINASYDLTNDDILSSFEGVMLDGGVFGFEASTLGDYYVAKNTKSNEKIGFKVKLKALFALFFPSVKALNNSYPYVSKCKLLIPFAYLHRMFDGLFKRNAHSRDTIKGIVNSNNGYSQTKAELMNELNLK